MSAGQILAPTEQALRASLAFESAAIRDRIDSLATQLPFVIERRIDLGAEPLEFPGTEVLVIEQRGERISPAIVSAMQSHPNALCVLLVRAPRDRIDGTLLDSGAFDVIDDGPELGAQLLRALAMGRRLRALREDRARLIAELAQREKLAALGTMAAGIGHDVNNACGAILGNAMAMRDDIETTRTLPDAQRFERFERLRSEWLESLDDVIVASRRIHQMIKPLALLSRQLEVLKPERIDLNGEIELLLGLIAKEVRYGVHFEVSLDSELPAVRVRPSAIGQIVTNLIVNALQALEVARPQHPWIGIRTHFDARHVVVEVGDNAGGMRPELLEGIFDAHPRATSMGESTGLGLPITRTLIERAGGEIFVDSVPGEGTRFRVMLPRDEAETVPEPLRANESITSDRLRVLIVDDDEMTLRAIERSLRSQFECITVTSGLRGLRVLRDNPQIDAVVTDIVMPGTNGMAFFEELSVSHPRLARRTVFVSGGILSAALLERVQQTGLPLLNKPVEPQELARLVRQLSSAAD